MYEIGRSVTMAAPFVLPAPALVKRSAKEVGWKRNIGMLILDNDHPDGSSIATLLRELRPQRLHEVKLVVVIYRVACFLLGKQALPDVKMEFADFKAAQHDERTEGLVGAVDRSASARNCLCSGNSDFLQKR